MLFPLYSSDPKLRDSILSVLPKLVVIADWSDLSNRGASARCVIVTLSGSSVAQDLLRLPSFRSVNPVTPVILIFDHTVDPAEIALADADEAIPASEIKRHLLQAVSRVWRPDQLSLCEIAGKFAHSLGVPPLVRTAVKLACDPSIPVTSVRLLAKRLGCGRSTLARSWRSFCGPVKCRLEDFLAWINLLRAASHRRLYRNWPHTAEQLGISHSALARNAVKLTGQTLGALASLGPGTLYLQFRERILDQLLGDPETF